MTECGTDSPVEHVLPEEDAVPISILSFSCFCFVKFDAFLLSQGHFITT